ncbi:hypothetical protein DPMN_117078, partial [Dreissena polymorpha]
MIKAQLSLGDGPSLYVYIQKSRYFTGTHTSAGDCLIAGRPLHDDLRTLGRARNETEGL